MSPPLILRWRIRILERVLQWIAKQIVVDGENTVLVKAPPTLITKASSSYPTKIWWAIVWEQEIPTTNDETLNPSLSSFVECHMVGYPVNLGQIIATKRRDKALNQRVGHPFPCLSGKLCRQANIPYTC